MNNFLEKIGIKGNLKKNFGIIILLAFGVAIISGLPFFRFEYYDVYLTTYNLTNTQMGVFGSIIGFFGIISYLFGGVIADGLNVKNIIVVSLLATGISGLIHLLPIGFYGLIIIYAIWGISTTFAFWPACVKAIRVMSDRTNQGKAYGFFEGGRNIAGGIIALVALILFRIGVSGMDNKVLAMKYVILFYSSVNIIMAVFAYYFIKDDKMVMASGSVNFCGVSKLLRNPAIWIICLLSFCNHVFCLSVYYYIPYTTQILGASVAFGATLGVLRRFGSIGGNITGGYLTDKIGTGKLMLWAYIIIFLLQIILLLVPVNPLFVPVVAILYVLILVFFNMNYAMSWTMISQSNIPLEYSGTAAGLISTVGSIPEMFVSISAGNIIDKNPGITGYKYIFYILTAIIGIESILIYVWIKHLKRKEKNCKIDESTKEDIKVCMH
ncbi:MFS transporter [Lagierella sp.]|uniref:MFS transporter n=1 Tax=Lagierella sp. TaxID=2849657 RepID=UPI002611CBB7|nr:MFS transporter [Lagierella sp.]